MENIISKIGVLDKYKNYLPNSLEISNFNRSLEELKSGLDTVRKVGRIFQIGIVGQMKTGKSSFLNEYLFDEEILPTAATPMTAALTLIKYADESRAEIEFYNRDDWEFIKENSQEYEKEYKKALENSRAECERKGRPFYEDRFRFENVDTILKGSYEIYNNFIENNLDESELGTIKVVPIKDKKNILNDLREYVGSVGKYTPLVKSTILYINDDRIKDYIIVDTPGTNDPIISRGQKTKEFLNKCDYIIFLSYSSQFLDNNDNEYIREKLPSGGQKDILILASKFDNQLSQESVFEDSEGNLEIACKEEKRKLQRKLERWRKEFEKEKNPLDLTKSELEFQSTMLYRIYKNFDNLQNAEKEIYERLLEDYENSTITRELLYELSGMPLVKKKIDKILSRKELIMNDKIKNLLEANKYTLKKVLISINKGFEERKFELSNKEIKELEINSDTLKNKIHSLSTEIKKLVKNEKEKLNSKLLEVISSISRDKEYYNNLYIKTESKEKVVMKSRGWFESLKFWPGTEYKTVRVNERFIEIQDSIEQISDFSDRIYEKIKYIYEKSVSKKAISREIKNALIDLFEIEDRPEVANVIDKYINTITIPEIEFNVNKYKNIVLSEYRDRYSKENNIDYIMNLHNKILMNIIEDVEKEFNTLKTKLIAILEDIENNIVNDLKKGIEQNLNLVKDQLKNQKESIVIVEQGIKEVKSCLDLLS